MGEPLGVTDLPPNPFIVADRAWVVAGETILRGVRMGSRAVIASGVVVTRDVPPGELWGGVPARNLVRTARLSDPSGAN